jgi:hypothetical protein
MTDEEGGRCDDPVSSIGIGLNRQKPVRFLVGPPDGDGEPESPDPPDHRRSRNATPPSQCHKRTPKPSTRRIDGSNRAPASCLDLLLSSLFLSYITSFVGYVIVIRREKDSSFLHSG